MQKPYGRGWWRSTEKICINLNSIYGQLQVETYNGFQKIYRVNLFLDSLVNTNCPLIRVKMMHFFLMTLCL